MSGDLTFEQALESLPAKRRLFVLAYLDCLNKTEAASRAGYSKPHPEGARLLQNATVAAAVELGLQRKTMRRDEVLARLTMLATASLEDFLTLETEAAADDSTFPSYGQPDAEGGEEKPKTPHPGHWRLDLAKAKRRGMLGALKKLKWGEHGPEIELHDPQPALQAIGKHYRLFIDRQEVSGPNGGPLVVDGRALAEADQELAEWRRRQTEMLSSISSAAQIVPTSPTTTDS